MTRNIYVPLPDSAREALYELAEREWRRPKEQASQLLVEGLRRAGVLDDQPRPMRTTRRPPKATAVLGRSKTWVVEKLASGLLPGIRDGNRWLVRRADLLRDGWIVDEEGADGQPVGGEKRGAAP